MELVNKYIVITGPTATGKTRRAVSLAKHIGGEIISADSRQVFRGMDIGSGKDLSEYENIPYHLIDICPAGYKYNLYEFLRDEAKARLEIKARRKTPILCGGTGLYVESVLKGIVLPEVPENKPLRDSLKDKNLNELTEMLASMKKMHNVSDVDTVQRAIRAIEIQIYYQEHPDKAYEASHPHPIKNAVIIGVDIDRDTRRKRISQRLYQRLGEGMVQEVESLIQAGVSTESLINYGLEYKFITQYLLGIYSYNEMVSKLEIAIHQFAKRQMTWFNGMERRGFKINWLRYDLDSEEFNEKIMSLLHE